MAFGIYGIWVENELVYVGKTARSFEQRFSEHRSGAENQGGVLYEGIRKAKRAGKKVKMKPILSFTSGVDKFTDRELSCMEYGLITYLKPKFNREGVVKKFRF